MGLNKYYIDGSSVPPEEEETVSKFIEGRAFTSDIDPNNKCSFLAFFDESEDPSTFPQLRHCKIQQLP